MNVMASQITGHSTVYLTVCLGCHERKFQSFVNVSLWGEYSDTPHKGPVTQKAFPIFNVIMKNTISTKMTLKVFKSQYCRRACQYHGCWHCGSFITVPSATMSCHGLCKMFLSFRIMSSKNIRLDNWYGMQLYISCFIFNTFGPYSELSPFWEGACLWNLKSLLQVSNRCFTGLVNYKQPTFAVKYCCKHESTDDLNGLNVKKPVWPKYRSGPHIQYQNNCLFLRTGKTQTTHFLYHPWYPTSSSDGRLIK